jgi:hypothetical protein
VFSERLFIPLRKSARPTGQDIEVHTKNLGGPLDNKLLSSLPRDQFDLLAPHLREFVISNASLFDIADELGRTVVAVKARAHAIGIVLRRSRFMVKEKGKMTGSH